MGGGGGQQQGGGDIMSVISRMMGGGMGGGPQGANGSQEVIIPSGHHGITPPIGGIDIPPADLHDPFGGEPVWAESPATDYGSPHYGFTPPQGLPGSWQGNTIIPTNFDAQGYPFAVLNTPNQWAGWSNYSDPTGLFAKSGGHLYGK